jgi:hypothetical protein
MYKLQQRRLTLLTVAAMMAMCPFPSRSAEDPTLTKEQIKQFLLTAKVISARGSKKGVTATTRLTLSDGTITHDGSFQPIDDHETVMQFADGSKESHFVDSYKYNIAAYGLAELLGLDDMVPVYVERKWEGKTGSLSWWLAVKMDEQDRVRQKIQPPDQGAWNGQMYKIRVLDELVSDADANLTNVLIGPDWQLYRIDFTRAFRIGRVREPKNLVHCDRQLFEKLKALNAADLTEKAGNYLSKNEIKDVITRRNQIVAQFQKLIAEKGENNVLY